MKKPARPKPFAVGRVRVRVHSGPRAEDGRWRWRADRPAGTRGGRDVRETVWSGWGTRDEAEQEVLLVEGLPRDVAVMVRVVLLTACAAAGVERFTAHGLRRMVALELLDATDPRTVAELTGHSVAILLRDYVRPKPERLRDVVGRAHGARVVLRAVGEEEE